MSETMIYGGHAPSIKESWYRYERRDQDKTGKAV